MVVFYLFLGYVIGSIPWALIIGKVFYHKDIRQYGSGNLGGSNAGRVLGKPAGVAVIVLDALKALLVMMVVAKLEVRYVPWAGLAVCVGHCFPCFAQFKGGKAVACGFGFLFGLGLYATGDLVFTFVFPLLFFFIVLGLTKYVSLASMTTMLFASLVCFLTCRNKLYGWLVLLLAIFVIYRHRSNIYHLLKGEESQITWLK